MIMVVKIGSPLDTAHLAGGGGEPSGIASDGAVWCGVAGKVGCSVQMRRAGRAQPLMCLRI